MTLPSLIWGSPQWLAGAARSGPSPPLVAALELRRAASRAVGQARRRRS